MTTPGWPAALPVAEVRIARPTNRLEELVRFYHEGLGLPVLGTFEDHDGYSGVMLGLPGRADHLEFTARADGGALPIPTADNLLVLYVADRAAVVAGAARLAEMGYHAEPPLNPYWARNGITIPDPDGWRIVLTEPVVGAGS